MKCSKMTTLAMEMLCFDRHQASNIEPKRVPGSSYLAVLWMAGCGQGDMGAVEGEMAVPSREEEQTVANGPAARQRAEGPGGVGAVSYTHLPLPTKRIV